MGTRSLRIGSAYMTRDIFSALSALLMKVGIGLLLANEIRGLVLSAPVFYGMYAAGGTPMAVWMGVCSLVGIAVSVLLPFFIARKFELV